MSATSLEAQYGVSGPPASPRLNDPKLAQRDRDRDAEVARREREKQVAFAEVQAAEKAYSARPSNEGHAVLQAANAKHVALVRAVNDARAAVSGHEARVDRSDDRQAAETELANIDATRPGDPITSEHEDEVAALPPTLLTIMRALTNAQLGHERVEHRRWALQKHLNLTGGRIEPDYRQAAVVATEPSRDRIARAWAAAMDELSPMERSMVLSAFTLLTVAAQPGRTVPTEEDRRRARDIAAHRSARSKR